MRKPMKAIIWGINYRPESTGIAPYNAELAEYLAREGHEVTMVTGFAYYPHWKKSRDDRWRLFRAEQIAGVRVRRCWLYVPRRTSTVRRILHELSFAVTSFFRVLLLPRADIYVIVSPPLLLGACGWLATRLKRSHYVFHVQDLQPGAAVGLGMVKSAGFIRVLFALERFAYAHAASVSGISGGMMEEFRRKGVPVQRRILFPNWLRRAPRVAVVAGEFRRKYQVPAGDLLAVYSGNLGRKQGIEILLEAAELLAADRQPAPITLLIAGAGAAREALARHVEALELPNLRLLPLLNDDDYAGMLADADVGLITQAAGTGRYFFPSKLLSLLQARVPVVTVADADSELARAVREGGFGINVSPVRPDELAQVLRRLAADRSHWAELQAATTWVQRFSPAAVLPGFARQLENIVAGPQSTPSEFRAEHEPSRL